MSDGKDFVILQARLHSTRLPEKLLLPLKGIAIFEHILKRLLRARLPQGIVVATTGSSEPHLRDISERCGVDLLVGSEEDVLSRYVEAVERYGLRHAVRATGDNPLVSCEYLDRALTLHRRSGADLTAFRGLPYGAGVEVVRGEVLRDVAERTDDPFEREHVTQHIYRNEGRYSILRPSPDPPVLRPELRLTVDTEEDYRLMTEIYDALYRGEPISLKDAIAYLDQKKVPG